MPYPKFPSNSSVHGFFQAFRNGYVYDDAVLTLANTKPCKRVSTSKNKDTRVKKQQRLRQKEKGVCLKKEKEKYEKIQKLQKERSILAQRQQLIFDKTEILADEQQKEDYCNYVVKEPFSPIDSYCIDPEIYNKHIDFMVQRQSEPSYFVHPTIQTITPIDTLSATDTHSTTLRGILESCGLGYVTKDVASVIGKRLLELDILPFRYRDKVEVVRDGLPLRVCVYTQSEIDLIKTFLNSTIKPLISAAISQVILTI